MMNTILLAIITGCLVGISVALLYMISQATKRREDLEDGFNETILVLHWIDIRSRAQYIHHLQKMYNKLISEDKYEEGVQCKNAIENEIANFHKICKTWEGNDEKRF